MRELAARIAAVNVGKQTRSLTRALHRGGGTSLPGMLAERIDPGLVASLSADLPHGCVLVTGTNGKTTTTRILADAAQRFGWNVLSNREGSNLSRGVATVLLEHSDRLGRLRVAPETLGLFEIDEGALPVAIKTLRPRLIVFTNLFRDQLDRYFELDFVAHLWREALKELPSYTTLVLNTDDPQIAYLGEGIETGVTYYGLDDVRQAQEGLEHAADSRRCPRCEVDLLYERTFYAHLGHYACGNCGWRRPPARVSGWRLELSSFEGAELEAATPVGNRLFHVPIAGLYNVYNALAAAAGALALGIDPAVIEQSVAAARPAFGRLERFEIRGRQVWIVLVKNPTGFNQALRLVLGDEDREVDTVLLALNDNGPDGRDVSWIWDVDFERMAERRPRLLTLSGSRTYDLALRLKYAGIVDDASGAGDANGAGVAVGVGDVRGAGESRLQLEPDVVRAFWSAVEQTPPGGTVYMLPTYTAMWTLRERLAREGHLPVFWQHNEATMAAA